MSRDQFISWLKGFVAAIEETPTKGQWETIVSELNKIQECTDWGSPIGVGGIGTVNTRSIITDGFIQNQSITRANPPSTLTTTTNKDVAYTLKDKE